jgi:hypothetical protein
MTSVTHQTTCLAAALRERMQASAPPVAAVITTACQIQSMA